MKFLAILGCFFAYKVFLSTTEKKIQRQKKTKNVVKKTICNRNEHNIKNHTKIFFQHIKNVFRTNIYSKCLQFTPSYALMHLGKLNKEFNYIFQ